MTTHKVVKHDQWLAARKRHLAKEKEFTRMRDQLSRERRNLPWELVEKPYAFAGEHGRQTLGELFEGRGQLVIYHAMFSPETAGPHTTWTADAPCFVCSFWMDNFNGITIHLNHRDITMVAVSRAPYPTLAAYKKRMGWGFPWLSSLGSDFNFDYRVSFTDEELKAQKVGYNYQLQPVSVTEGPGISVFLKDGGQIYHTYSTYADEGVHRLIWYRPIEVAGVIRDVAIERRECGIDQFRHRAPSLHRTANGLRIARGVNLVVAASKHTRAPAPQRSRACRSRASPWPKAQAGQHGARLSLVGVELHALQDDRVLQVHRHAQRAEALHALELAQVELFHLAGEVAQALQVLDVAPVLAAPRRSGCRRWRSCRAGSRGRVVPSTTALSMRFLTIS